MRAGWWLAITCTATVPAAAQHNYWGAALVITPPGEPLGCETHLYNVGVGIHAGRALSDFTSLQAGVRANVLSPSTYGGCFFGSTPGDSGVYTVTDQVGPLSRKFVTTEIRGRVHLGETALASSLGFGAGVVWREGNDMPFVVAGARAVLPASGRVVFAFNADFQVAHQSWTVYQLTVQNGQVISNETVGQGGEWTRVIWLGMSIEWH